MKAAWLGMDLGGSNLFSVAYASGGASPILESKVDTESRKGYDHVRGRIASQILEMRDALAKRDYDLRAIGLGVPGAVDASRGFIHIAPNLEWKEVHLVDDLPLPAEDADLKDRIRLINDVNAGLNGELSLLHPIPAVAVAYFCGTGIGGAIALGGQIFTGADGSAGEVGHMVIEKGGRRCQCGSRGCLEAYIGKWALNARIQRALIKNKSTQLKQLIDYDLTTTPVKSASLKKAYLKKDAFTRKLLERYYASHLAAGISQTANLLSPELIILGGGIIESLGEFLLPHIYSRLEKNCIGAIPTIRLAALGDYSGPRGAALFAGNAVAEA